MNGAQPAHVSTEGELAGTVYAQLMLGETLMRRNGLTPVPADHVAAFRAIAEDWQVRATGPIAAPQVPKVETQPDQRPTWLTTEQAAKYVVHVSESYLLRLAKKNGIRRDRDRRGRWNREDIECLAQQRRGAR